MLKFRCDVKVLTVLYIILVTINAATVVHEESEEHVYFKLSYRLFLKKPRYVQVRYQYVGNMAINKMYVGDNAQTLDPKLWQVLFTSICSPIVKQ